MRDETIVDQYTAYRDEIQRILAVQRERSREKHYRGISQMVLLAVVLGLCLLLACDDTPINRGLESFGGVWQIVNIAVRIFAALGMVLCAIGIMHVVCTMPGENRMERVPEETLALIAHSNVLPVSIKARIAKDIQLKGYATFEPIYEWLDALRRAHQLSDLSDRPGTRDILEYSKREH